MPYQHAMPLPQSKWHYTRVIWGSNGQFLHPSGTHLDAQRLVNPVQCRLSGGGLSDMQGAAIALAERRRHPLLHREDLAQPGPGHGVPGQFQFAADRLHQLIGQHGDEQVPSVRSSV